MQGDRSSLNLQKEGLKLIQSLIVHTGLEKTIGINPCNLKRQRIQRRGIPLQKPIEERKGKLASNVEKKDTMLISVRSEERSMSWILIKS